jgi:rRNA-processing protein EBP2
MGVVMKRKLKSREEGGVQKLPKITLEEIEEISTDDDDDEEEKFGPTLKRKPNSSQSRRRRGIEMGREEEDDDDEEEEGELEARALRKAILEGAFDKFQCGQDSDIKNEIEDHADNDDDDSEESRHDDDQEEQALNIPTTNVTKALLTKAEELSSSSSHNWVETFDILSKDPLPFHEKSMRLDVHDDLKRELAFYNMALEAVREAKDRCKAAKVPFTRPDDFFAEMIKTDGK